MGKVRKRAAKLALAITVVTAHPHEFGPQFLENRSLVFRDLISTASGLRRETTRTEAETVRSSASTSTVSTGAPKRWQRHAQAKQTHNATCQSASTTAASPQNTRLFAETLDQKLTQLSRQDSGAPHRPTQVSS